jgi:hypothetical protein
MSRYLLIGLTCIGLSCVGPRAPAESVSAGCDRLQVLLDPRLSSGAVEHAWASGQPRSEAPAILQLRSCTDQLLDQLVLEAPLARLDPVPLRGAPAPTHLVSVDLTAAAGSYNGPLTIPVQVQNHHLLRVAATGPDGHVEPIQLALTGKAAWKKISVGSVDDLLSVSCQPEGDSFVIFYRRYHPTRDGWRMLVRSKPGFWESDGEFPEIRRFP